MCSKNQNEAFELNRRSHERYPQTYGQQLIVKDLKLGQVVLCKDIYEAARLIHQEPVVIYSALKEPVENRVIDDRYFVKKPPETWPYL